uniref:Protein kinase domain-containing protein n=1 Tax=Denticeps clupeoides TaxID=299321 RepID=A0AAY4C3N3_9TELE
MALFKLQNVEDFYEIGDVLGSGHYGQVCAVRERATGARWAGKFLKLRRSASSRLGLERKSVEKEVEILQALPHCNIMALKDVFESRAEVVLIVELIGGGELFDFVAEKENLSEGEAIEFMKQILEAVSFMHSKKIAHFDLKPENMMLLDKEVSHPHIKIIDFGLAHCFIQGKEYKSLSGTPQYIAPEVINYEPLSVASDMWFCVTPYRLSGMSPFQGDTDEETLRNIVSMNYEFEDRYFSDTSAVAKDFIQNLLVKDPSGRLTAEECLVHPWIKPLTRNDAASRNRSSINMKNFKKFNARRKWKMSYNMVWACNRLCRMQLLCKSDTQEDSDLRKCESDQEDTETKPASLIRLSSNS